jgi:hypothetical protein
MRKNHKFERARATLFAAALSTLFIAGCGVRTAENGSFDRMFQVTGPVRLELVSGKGDARVTAGPPGEVRIHGELRVKSWSHEGGRHRLQDIAANPPVSQDGNLIHIGGASRRGSDSESVSIDFTIVVPPDTEIHGSTGSGDVNVGGLRGPVSFQVGSGTFVASEIAGDVQASAGSGDLHFSDVQGRAQASGGSGKITLDSVKGEARLRTGSGVIHVNRPGDTVVATTGSGTITVTGASNDVRLQSSSGNLTVDGDPAASSYWDFRAGSGNVVLQVPASGNFRFYARTSSGNIESGIPIVMEGTSAKHELHARIGEGKGRVEVSTSSGNITLR